MPPLIPPTLARPEVKASTPALHPLATPRITALDKSESFFNKLFNMRALGFLSLIGMMAGLVTSKSKEGGRTGTVAKKIVTVSNLPQTSFKDMSQAVGAVNSKAGKAISKSGQYAQRSTLGHTIGGRFGVMSPFDVAQVIFSAFSLLRIARNYRDRQDALKELWKVVREDGDPVDMPKNVKDLPPIMQVARKRSMGKRVGVAATLQALVTAFSMYAAGGGKMPGFMQKDGMKGTLLQMGVWGGLNTLPDMIIGENPADIYRIAHMAHAQDTMAVQDEKGFDMYDKLVGNFALGMSYTQSGELAAKFRAAKMDPDAVIKEIAKIDSAKGETIEQGFASRLQSPANNQAPNKTEGRKWGFTSARFALGAVMALSTAAGISYVARHSKEGREGIFSKVQDTFSRSGART